MRTRNKRLPLVDGSFVEFSLTNITRDKWRPHGVKYRLAWIDTDGVCRVLFDNHRGKKDHYHVDGKEFEYEFESVEKLEADFMAILKRMGVKL